MEKKKSKVYRCAYCDKAFDNSAKADGCRVSHKLIFLGLSKPDLNNLLNYIYTGEEALLTESLIKAIRKAQFGAGR